MRGCGTWNKTDACFKLNWGPSVWVRTNTEPDSVVGISRVRAVWGDEAGKYSLYFWENLEGRAAPMNAPILLTTSPYSLNWIWKDLIKPHQEGRRDDVKLIQAASVENPYFNKAAYEKRRLTMDPRRFAMMYGGQWGRMSGLVYDCWDDAQNRIDPFELPQGTRYYGGIDWGHTEPFVLVVRAITPDGRHYQVSEFYKSGFTVSDMIQIAKQKKQTYGIQKFWAGPDQPGLIEEFCRNGLPTEGADNDIRRGIDAHYELIKTRRYKIFNQSSPHTLDELETYHYPEPEDLGPDDSAKELKPVGQNDHALDANRYLTISTVQSQFKSTPKTPDEHRIKTTDPSTPAFLKRRRSTRGAEQFS